MAGYRTVLQIQRLQQEIEELGFRWGHSKHGTYRDYGDVVALMPKDDESLPIYNRDAEIFCGTMDDLERWLQGVKWARDYDRMLGLSTANRRQRKEQDWRNRNLLSKIAQAGKDESTS